MALQVERLEDRCTPSGLAGNLVPAHGPFLGGVAMHWNAIPHASYEVQVFGRHGMITDVTVAHPNAETLTPFVVTAARERAFVDGHWTPWQTLYFPAAAAALQPSPHRGMS